MGERRDDRHDALAISSRAGRLPRSPASRWIRLSCWSASRRRRTRCLAPEEAAVFAVNVLANDQHESLDALRHRPATRRSASTRAHVPQRPDRRAVAARPSRGARLPASPPCTTRATTSSTWAPSRRRVRGVARAAAPSTTRVPRAPRLHEPRGPRPGLHGSTAACGRDGASSGIGEALAEGLAPPAAGGARGAPLDRLDALAARSPRSARVPCGRLRRRERRRRRAARERDASSLRSRRRARQQRRHRPSRSRRIEPQDHFDSVVSVNLGGNLPLRAALRARHARAGQRLDPSTSRRSSASSPPARFRKRATRGQGAVREPHARAGGAVGAPRRSAVNALAPAWFPTEMTRRCSPTRRARSGCDRHAMGRAGRVEELAGRCLPRERAASYVTGHVLLVDGAGPAS